MPLEFYDTLRRDRLDALRRDFFPRLPAGAPITLEIGCGHGHYLNAYAEAHPHAYCVGVDLIADRIARATRKANRAGLANLAFVQAEAGLFLSALSDWRSTSSPADSPAHRLQRVFILFSDPWPKRRHWKHRLLQPALLETLGALSLPETTLHFRTDHPDYFAYAQAIIAEHPGWRIAAPDEAAGTWPFEHVSVFEERALAGAPRSLTAVRVTQPPPTISCTTTPDATT